MVFFFCILPMTVCLQDLEVAQESIKTKQVRKDLLFLCVHACVWICVHAADHTLFVIVCEKCSQRFQYDCDLARH